MGKTTPRNVANEESTSAPPNITDLQARTPVRRAVLWATLQEIVGELTLEYAEEMRADARDPPDSDQFEHADLLAEITRIAEQEMPSVDERTAPREVEVTVKNKE